MKLKYATIGVKKTTRSQTPGRITDPNSWKTGPNLEIRELYYAWLKHRAQCRYRNEAYDLTWEDWQAIWPLDLFRQRGKTVNSLCLNRINMDDSWNIHNVQVITRAEQLKRNGEYRKNV